MPGQPRWDRLRPGPQGGPDRQTERGREIAPTRAPPFEWDLLKSSLILSAHHWHNASRLVLLCRIRVAANTARAADADPLQRGGQTLAGGPTPLMYTGGGRHPGGGRLGEGGSSVITVPAVTWPGATGAAKFRSRRPVKRALGIAIGILALAALAGLLVGAYEDHPLAPGASAPVQLPADLFAAPRAPMPRVVVRYASPRSTPATPAAVTTTPTPVTVAITERWRRLRRTWKHPTRSGRPTATGRC